MCTLKATIAFFFLFFTLDLAFLMLALAYYFPTAAGGANVALNTAGGVFGILAAFAAWYNALAGLLEPTNSFFLIPVSILELFSLLIIIYRRKLMTFTGCTLPLVCQGS